MCRLPSGIVLICAVLTNALVLICVVAAQMVSSGLSSMGGLGGFDINSNFNLQGTELQKVRELDMQYSQMRAPGIYGGIAFSLTLGVLSLLFVVAGSKPPHRMSRKLLYGALVFQAVGAVAYVVAVGLYLHFIIGVNSTDVCQQRERLYARNGYTWMNCDVSGADAAVALFGLITAILYTAGTVLTIQTIRGVKRYLQERQRREAEKQQGRSQPQRAPLRAATTSVWGWTCGGCITRKISGYTAVCELNWGVLASNHSGNLGCRANLLWSTRSKTDPTSLITNQIIGKQEALFLQDLSGYKFTVLWRVMKSNIKVLRGRG